MQFTPTSILSLVPQLGAFLKQAVDHYATLRAAGKDASVEVVTVYLCLRMADWDPKISGVSLVDSETRQAGARFLSGVAVNIARA
jgi:hypothetical protein